MIQDEIFYKYAKDAVEGKITVGYYVKCACQRFFDDLQREDLEFRLDKVKRVIQFISLFKHSLGKFAGKNFILEPWQQFICANIYGFYRKNDGSRRYTQAYIEIARKQGKTQLAAALGLYALAGEGEHQAQVICAANSKEQAKILLNAATSLIKTVDINKKYFVPFRSEIRYAKKDSFLKIVSADTSKLDGLNCSTFIIDELHEAKDSKMFDVLRSSQGMRQNPLAISITTAGFNKSSYCYHKRSACCEVLSKVKEDDSLFCVIYTIDENDDWTDSKVWCKCQPNLGITTTEKYMQDQIVSAKTNPSEEVGVRTKLINQWCDSSQTWIPEHYILKGTEKVDLNRFTSLPCYVGVDLSSTSDLTAVSYLIVDEDKYYFKTHYYLPQQALIEKPLRETYKLWQRQGYLTITEGNVVDYDYITNDIMKYNEIVNIQSIGYDKYNATQWAIKCTELNLPLREYSQSIGNFNIPTREIERLLLSGQAIIDNNEINRFCFRNVVLKTDHNGNVKPNKAVVDNKIDGVIAMIQALGMYLLTPKYSNEIMSI